MKRLRYLLLCLSLVGGLSIAAPAPANAATCDELTQVYCTAAGTACFLLYKLHVTSDPGCIN